MASAIRRSIPIFGHPGPRRSPPRCIPAIRISNPTIDFLEYDDLFDKAPLNPGDVSHRAGQAAGQRRRSRHRRSVRRARAALQTCRRSSNGPRVWWRNGPRTPSCGRTCAMRVLAKMNSKSYDVVLAHSLGSLICYDTFVRNPKEIKDKVFVTFGSQIGNPAVRDVFAGRIEALASRMWYHLFNPDDHVLTYPLEIAADNFVQVTETIRYPQRCAESQRDMVPRPRQRASRACGADVVGDRSHRGPSRRRRAQVASGPYQPDRRALLIGINNYPDPAQCSRRMRERRVLDEFGAAGKRLRAGGNPRRARRPGNGRRDHGAPALAA